MAEIIVKDNRVYLHVNGFLYLRHNKGKKSVYWRCREYSGCSARVTANSAAPGLQLKRQPFPSDHPSHAPDFEAVRALKLIVTVKRKAEEHPGASPAQIMRTLADVPGGVLSQLSDRENMTKMIQRQRLKNLPVAPRSIADFEAVPLEE